MNFWAVRHRSEACVGGMLIFVRAATVHAQWCMCKCPLAWIRTCVDLTRTEPGGDIRGDSGPPRWLCWYFPLVLPPSLLATPPHPSSLPLSSLISGGPCTLRTRACVYALCLSPHLSQSVAMLGCLGVGARVMDKEATSQLQQSQVLHVVVLVVV